MLKKYFILVLLLSLSENYSQSFFFDKDIKDDAIKAQNYFENLENFLSKNYEYQNGVSDSLKKRMYFYLAKNEYESSLETIYQFRRNLSAKGWDDDIYFLHEIYAKASIQKQSTINSFDKSIEIATNNYFKNLPNYTFAKFNNVFDKNGYHKKSYFNYIENLNIDSLSFSSGFKLLELYTNYKIESKIFSTVKKCYKALNDDLFIIETKDVSFKNGTLLSLTIVRNKKNNKKSSTILSSSIYAGENDTIMGKRSALHDYVGVVVNPRGKRNSTSEIAPFEHEAEDIYYVIDWISKQKWSNKKVGMIGGSYLGFSQWAATKNLHPSLKTIVPQVAVGIGAYDFPMNNNIFMSYMIQWIDYVTSNNLTNKKDFYDFNKWDSIFENWFKSGKSFRDLDSISGGKSKIFQRWLDHPSHDAYWQKMIPQKEEFNKINIPILTTTGYYDDEQRGALYYLKEHYKYNKNPNHYLVIGPYNHATGQSYPRNVLYGYQLDSVARISMNDLAYEWFDYVLKNKKKPEILKDKINFQVMNLNKWVHTNDLEKISNDKINFYLKSTLNHSESIFTKPTEKKFTSLTVDFKDRELKNKYYTAKKDSIYIDEKTIVFESENLKEDMVISGAFKGQIKVAINKKDFDFSVKLMQIESNGEFFNLSNFLGRASYLENHSKRKLLTPNKETILPIDNSMLVSKKIEKGSRLILLINIIYNKDNQVNYGTGKDVSDESILDANEPLEIKWYNDSYIEIPILK